MPAVSASSEARSPWRSLPLDPSSVVSAGSTSYFREIVEHQVINWATLNLAHGCIKEIAPKTLAGSNANFLFHIELCRNRERRNRFIFHFPFSIFYFSSGHFLSLLLSVV